MMEDIFLCILFKETFYELIQILLKHVPMGTIDNTSIF